ncbi:MAG: hypothetical protein AAFZ89_00575 [Bacteroidota bacterium]
MKTRYLILVIVIISIGSIIYGFTLKENNLPLAHKCIGFGTLGLFFIAMPMFLIKESKGKKVKDYMLTDENIKKMRAGKDENPKNQ